MAARQAQLSNDQSFAANQLALVAHRLRTLFAEVSPQDKSIAIAVKDTLLISGQNLQALKDKVLARLSETDADFQTTAVNGYYQKLLDSWLGPFQK